MKVWSHISISLLASMLMCPGGVNSMTFKFDPELTKAGPITSAKLKLMNKIDWMDKLAVRLNEQIKAMEKALNAPNSVESRICRPLALGPLNEREGIKQELYRSFMQNFERMERATVKVKDLNMKLHRPDRHIAWMDYLRTDLDEWGNVLTGRALHIADEFFDQSEYHMLDELLRVVFVVVNKFWAQEFLVARRRDIAGQFTVHPHPQNEQFDSKLWDLVAATVDEKEGYHRVLSLPAGVQLSHLNPNVYSSFAYCLDVATHNDHRHIQKVNLKLKGA